MQAGQLINEKFQIKDTMVFHRPNLLKITIRRYLVIPNLPTNQWKEIIPGRK